MQAEKVKSWVTGKSAQLLQVTDFLGAQPNMAGEDRVRASKTGTTNMSELPELSSRH